MLLCPFLIVIVTGKGVKALKGMVPFTLATGLSFVIPQLIVAKFVGAELAVIVGAVCSLIVSIVLASKKETDPEYKIELQSKEKITTEKALRAWSPFILIFVFLLLTSKLVTPINTFLSQFASTVTIYTGENPGSLTFSWINTPGVWIFLAAFIGGILQGANLPQILNVLKATVKQMSETMLTMLSVLGCAKIMGYAGNDYLDFNICDWCNR